ncbi:MAG: BlaI/MecI/CopY family transcriptional regulator [Candidatus Heimdallarchaeota archaeon]|nr:BlaI/MecI/CopY family transcriptional regulator [Candidatus Heimdallarchaeota archaeon]
MIDIINYTPKSSCIELIQKFYSLNTLEYEIYEKFWKYKEIDVNYIVNLLENRERTFINRSLKRLLHHGLINREKKSQKGKRGFYYIYKLTSLEIIKEKMRLELDDFYSSTKNQISQIPQL